MKITFKTDDFKKRLAQVGSVIDKNAAMPAYKCVLLWAYDKPGTMPPFGVRITGVGISASFSVEVDAAPEGVFSVLLPFGKLSDIIGNLKAPEVSITLNDDNSIATVRAGKYKADVQTVQADFPEIMAQPAEHTAILGLPEFIAQIEKSEFAVPKNDGRFTSTVAKFEATQSSDGDKDTSTIRLVGTDGFRIAISSAAKNVGTFNLILPKDALDLIRKLEGGKDVTMFDGGDAGFMFTTERETLTVTKNNGEFPPYERVLPSAYQTSFTIDAAALLDSIYRLAPLADSENPIVVFSAAQGQSALRLTAANSSTGGDNAEDEVDLVSPVTGPTVAFALRYGLLTDFLSRTSGGINVRANDATQVIDFYADSGAYRYLQMPQKV